MEGARCPLVRIYEELDDSLKTHGADHRSFLLECADGVVREIVGIAAAAVRSSIVRYRLPMRA